MKSFAFRVFVKISMITVFYFLCLSDNVLASGSLHGSVRVGIVSAYKGVNSVPISDKTLNIGVKNGEQIINMGQITAESSFVVYADNMYYIDTDYFYNDYQSARIQADIIRAGGNNAVSVLKSGGYGVYIGGYGSEQAARQALDAGIGVRLVHQSSQRVRLDDGSSPAALFDGDLGYPLFSGAGYFTLGTKSYRGYLETGRYTGGLITAVNVINIEEYLYSVLPSEMPSGWHIEALKAQAVAARCYTYTRMGIHKEEGYELCDASHCQVYGGRDYEKEGPTMAVIETSGLAAYYNNEIINATFFASSGGITDNSENVWSNKIDYLRSVTDPYDTTGKVWTRTFTMSEIGQYLAKNSINIGTVQSVTVSALNEAGRVKTLTINGTAGSKALEKEEIRNFFASSSGGILESRYFTIGEALPNQPTAAAPTVSVVSSSAVATVPMGQLYAIAADGPPISLGGLYIQSAAAINQHQQTASATVAASPGATSAGGSVTFSGRGNGHGVGMSQHGAKGMAEAGFTFLDILKYYYRGIEVK